MKDTDIIINGAGNVTFNPPLESALRTNVVGSNNILKMARMMKRPALVHVSTCFVAGKRSGADLGKRAGRRIFSAQRMNWSARISTLIKRSRIAPA